MIGPRFSEAGPTIILFIHLHSVEKSMAGQMAAAQYNSLNMYIFFLLFTVFMSLFGQENIFVRICCVSRLSHSSLASVIC